MIIMSILNLFKDWFLSSAIILICIFIDRSLLLSSLNFQMFTFNLDLRQNIYWSFFLVIFCFLVLINSFNLMDGINIIASAFVSLFL